MGRIMDASDKLSHTQGSTFNTRKMYLENPLIDFLKNAVAKRIQERPLTENELARYKRVNPADPFAVKRLVDSLKTPGLLEYVRDVYYSSFLSGPKLLFVNNPGCNSLWLSSLIGHRGLTAGIGRLQNVIVGAPRNAYFGEVGKMVKSIEGSYKEGARRAWEVLKTGETPQLETRWEYDITEGMMSAFARSPYKWANTIAPFIEGPTRILRAGDLFNKTIAFDMQMNALAFRSATKAGLVEGTLKWDEYVSKLLAKPPSEMLKNAGDFANTATFTDIPGPITKGVLSLRNKTRVGFFAMPFVVTLSNMLSRGMELTPGIGVVAGRANKLSGASIIAKQIEGSVLTWILMELFKDNVTAGMPQFPAERDAFIRQGKIPWAVKINGRWVPYGNLQPFSILLQAVATGIDSLNRAKTTQDAGEVFAGIANNVVQATIDNQYFSNVVGLFDKGERGRIIRRIPVGFVPYSSFMRQVSNWYSDIQGEPVYSRTSQNTFDELANIIPGIRDTPPRINAFGEDMRRPRASWHLWYPFNYSEETADPVEMEIARLNAETEGRMGYPAIPDTFIEIRGHQYKIPQDVYRDFAYSYGRATKAAFERTISSRIYGRLSDEGKMKALQMSISHARALENAKFKRQFSQLGLLESQEVLPRGLPSR
jgi:hypothetical protein